MCHFLSGLALPNGDVLALPEYTDSHSDLIEHFGLRDDGREPELQRFVRVEFSPSPLANAADVSKYALRLDEDRTPPWWEAIRESVQEKMAAMIRRMIVADERPLLLGGCWILGGHSVVHTAKGARIVVAGGSSQVGELFGSSQVGELRDSSQVGALRDSSRVGALFDSSQVGVLYDSSQIGVLFGSSQVGKLRGSSRVVRDSRVSEHTDKA